MFGNRQIISLYCVMSAMTFFCGAKPQPDSAGHAPLPGPGLSYGGIPYGSMSGNVAEYFKRQGPSVGRDSALRSVADLEFGAIEQYL